jgi:peptidoglycan/LPS O-acetylase OafA/YrhL
LHWSLQGVAIAAVVFSAFVIFKPFNLAERTRAAGGVLLLLVIALLITRDLPTWGRHVFLDARLVSAAVIISGLLMFGMNISSAAKAIVRPFLRAGPISYALYVVHLPILYFLTDLLRWRGVPTYCVIPALVPIIALAWCLEMPFQRWITRRLDAGRDMVEAMLLPRPAATR